jgi:hypothetical protein
MTVVRCVLACPTVGMIEASVTRGPVAPITRHCGSRTDGIGPAARSAGRGGNQQHGPPAEDDFFGYDARQRSREPIEAAIAIVYRAAAVADDAGMLNRAFCSSLSVA